MSIYDDARALGNAILECEEAVNVAAAREAFEKDEVAKTLVDEYAALKDQWQLIMSNPDGDKSNLTQLGEQIVTKENEIKENTVTLNLLQAESQFGAYVNSIFGLISATIQGQDMEQGGCDPSCCSSCGGGCH